MFQLKKRPPDYLSKKGRKDDRMGPPHGALSPEKLPYLVELSPGATPHVQIKLTSSVIIIALLLLSYLVGLRAGATPHVQIQIDMFCYYCYCLF